MVSLWVTIGLVISAIAVSALGATFSVAGIGKLFDGAAFAVSVMGASLELAKFMVAAYIHQTWDNLNRVYRYYLVTSVVTLSIITSIGIFGFLSDAYSSATVVLRAEEVRLAFIEKEQGLARAEIERLQQSVKEIPDRRMSARLRAQNEVEPLIRELQRKIVRSETELAEAKIKMINVHKKVGPLLYISKAFGVDVDTLVKYFIILLVSVFDPLAICLVIAISDSKNRSRSRSQSTTAESQVETRSMNHQEPLAEPQGTPRTQKDAA